MNYRKGYILLAIAGFAAPWFFLLNYLYGDQVSIPVFFDSIFANHVSSAVAADLVVSALVFLVFVFAEAAEPRLAGSGYTFR